MGGLKPGHLIARAQRSLPGNKREEARGARRRLDSLHRSMQDLSEQVAELKSLNRQLEEQVRELSDELLDARSQGRRIGEISDLVTELLANEASRRDPEFQRILARYLDE